jgi:hypothetical protein
MISPSVIFRITDCSFLLSKAYAVGNAIYILGITSLFLLRTYIQSPSEREANFPQSYRKHHHLGYFLPSEPCSDDDLAKYHSWVSKRLGGR